MKNKQMLPWYQTTYRWLQTNLTEIDPVCCDVGWWKEYWKKNKIQGIIVNAGGIVAYYPSNNPLQYRAKYLGDRDLFQEFTQAAQEMGIVVLARMDVNRASQDFYEVHPDWFTVDINGNPYRTDDERYFSCVNSGYYKEYIPGILKEIVSKYHPQGFTDNSWTGMSRDKICYCENCKQKFLQECGHPLPKSCDLNDPIYRKWITWSHRCRTENWDLFNSVTTAQGGENCLWLGMMNVNPAAPYFCDLVEIGKRSKIVMSDYQSRDSFNGFEQNKIYGSVLSNLTGWEKIHPESMANYVRGDRVFRRSSNPVQETRLWMAEGFAGQLSPWLHYVGGCQDDRRQFENCPSMMQWHEENEEYLYNRRPYANVGLLWSQENTLFYGRNEVHQRMELPWRGFTRALTKAHIPYQPVNAHLLSDSIKELKVIILPDLAVVSDEQYKSIMQFMKDGGSIVYTGASGLFNSDGEMRSQFLLDELLGIHHTQPEIPQLKPAVSWQDMSKHTYFRLPQHRHPILDGFENTDILPFGGTLQPITIDKNLHTVCTYIPPFPIYPPELSYMETSQTQMPCIVAGETGYGGRVVYFAADVDRCYGEIGHPDHGKLLEQAIRFAAQDSIPLKVVSPGYLDCSLYRQKNRILLHIVNLNVCSGPSSYAEEILPVGPVRISVKQTDFPPKKLQCRVSGATPHFSITDEWIHFSMERLGMHELILIE